MFGGELLATGSSSCIFNPNFPCKKNGLIDDERISKIIFNPGAKEETQHEKKMNEAIKKIKGYSSWAIIFDQFCKPFPKDTLSTYDKRGMDDCLYDEDFIDEFDENSYMMNGIYGGETMDDKFMSMFEGKKMSPRQRDNKFLELMKMMEPLFLGLKKMDEKKIIHNDIKPINIVFHDGVFKYIDFGLAGLLSNKNHFKQRSLDELMTDRFYIYYPIDYLLYYASSSKLDEEVERVNTKYERRNYDILNIIHMIFGRKGGLNVIEEVVQQIRDKNINQTTMIRGIDTYSLGILIPLLFLRPEVNHLLKEESNLINDFYVLFSLMTTPIPKLRITAEKAYKQFKGLLKKYSQKKTKRVSLKKRNKRNKRKKSIPRVRRGAQSTRIKRITTKIKKRKGSAKRGNKNRRAS